jgi:1-acyl-sn-glycerol-3-phosphate acyltransferase
MRTLWLHTVRFYIKLGLFFYFRKIKVTNSKTIPINQPVLILANHQNALLDALLIAVTCKQFSFFLTRAGVFNNRMVGKFLRSLNMIPVYRIRDGWQNLTNNNAIFQSCTELLNAHKTIAIFPEGNHNLQRRVRPLSKGFTRIVFDALDKHPELNLHLVPVGFNYEQPECFGDSVSIIYGQSINAKDFLGSNRSEAIIKLKDSIFYNLTKLTTHIPPDNYEEALNKLNELNVDFLNPLQVNKCIVNNFKGSIGIRKNRFLNVKRVFKTLVIILLIIPYIIWKLVVQPKVIEKEFMATFRFAVAVSLVPIFILVVVCFLLAVSSVEMAFMYIGLVLLFQLIAVKL